MSIYLTPEGEAVTPDELAQFESPEQRDIMETWFRSRFKDPNESQPLDSDMATRLKNMRGPYEADYVLFIEFSLHVDQNVIDALVKELNTECSFWALTDKYRSIDDDVENVTEYHDTLLSALCNVRLL